MMKNVLQLLSEERPLVMGVLNLTPDSFFDGGRYLSLEKSVKHALAMLDEGADILDLGGQSTRPPGKTYGDGAVPVTLDEELDRVIPVIEAILREAPDAIISVDTVKSEVASRAIGAGAAIINDVSAGTVDTAMFSVAANLQVPIVLMHGYGPEFTKDSVEEYEYSDVVVEVKEWLRLRIADAYASGIRTVLGDIGFGFAKSAKDNIELLRRHREFTLLGVPMVLGVSRKSTIGAILGGVPPQEREAGSLAAALYGVANGAKLIRTHDVKSTKDALLVFESVRDSTMHR